MKSGKKLKIGFVFDDSLDTTDGVAQYVKVVGKWLGEQGHEVSYLVGETKLRQWHGGPVYSLADNISVNFNGNRLSIPLPANNKDIRKVLNAHDFDVLHVQAPYSPFMAQRVISNAAPSTAIIGSFHVFPAGFLARQGSRLLRVLYLGGLKKFDKLLAVSPAAQSYARDIFKVKTEVSPNVVELKRFRAGSRQAPKQGRIVFLGRLVERKGARQLIEAFALADSISAGLNLKIAGDGPQRGELEALTRKLGLEDKIEFLGFIDEADKPKLLASAQVACFPALYGESFGIVLIEAMAAGAGVVMGGGNPGYRTVLGARQELLIDPNDKEAFAQRLVTFIDDKKIASELHEWQSEEVKRYDVENVGRQLEDIYVRAIALKHKTSHNKSHGK